MRELCLLGCPVDAASAIQFQVLPWVRGEKVYRRWRVYCTTCKSLDKRRERTRDQQGSAPPVTTLITQGQHILDDDDYTMYITPARAQHFRYIAITRLSHLDPFL